MTPPPDSGAARRGAAYFNGGFLTDRSLRRILDVAGYDLRLGRARKGQDVLVWGHSPYAKRGEAAAARRGATLVRVEDAFLRSLHPGRSGAPTLGLVIDRKGMHFDANGPSDLEDLLAHHPLDDTALLDRARDAIARMSDGHLTKYAAVDPCLAPPDPGYVLVINQTRGDASIRLGQANADSFAEMLAWAREDHPGAPIVIKSHPETQAGHRSGHFDPASLPDGVTLEERAISPWTLFEGARAVYTVTSQLGFEAILAGHRPVTFGVPFYAGWGLSDDRRPVPARRNRTLTRAQLAAAALILYPTWYDPYRYRLGQLEDVLGALGSQARAWREDRAGYLALGMRRWKRRHLRAFFGGHAAEVHFADTSGAALGDPRPILVWAGRDDRDLRNTAANEGRRLGRVEDGVLRSRGLGAALVPPLSLVVDDIGISYDTTRPSRLEDLIARAARLSEPRLRLAAALRDAICKAGLTKYNLGGLSDLPDPPKGRAVMLVPGQVEDDASILLGASDVATNFDLVRNARRLYPEAWIIYKPHPDVEAGLRQGAVPNDALLDLVDHVAYGADTAALLGRADRVVTMTSGLGFEALLRGVSVTTLGAPFYAGWGLTRDLGDVPKRRTARPSIDALVHATLITYPRYFDPVSGVACPPEVAVARLISGDTGPKRHGLAALSWAQGVLKRQSWLWRRG